MPDKEATARIKIRATDLDTLGENFEKAAKGYVDFLLLDGKGFPFVILEAKEADKNPLVGKEQARRYAKSQNCRFVMLDILERKSPHVDDLIDAINL